MDYSIEIIKLEMNWVNEIELCSLFFFFHFIAYIKNQSENIKKKQSKTLTHNNRQIYFWLPTEKNLRRKVGSLLWFVVCWIRGKNNTIPRKTSCIGIRNPACPQCQANVPEFFFLAYGYPHLWLYFLKTRKLNKFFESHFFLFFESIQISH